MVGRILPGECSRLETVTRLCNVRFTTVNANIDLSAVTISQGNGDFVAASLAQVMNTDAINSVVVQSWIDKAGTCCGHHLLT
jgi:hypothetical protein